jgi:hypothetical protein
VTLIAIRTGQTFAEVLTDTLTYSVGEAVFTQSDKVRAFPVLQMAVTAKGPAELGAEWAFQLDRFGPSMVDDLDEVDLIAPQALAQIWAEIEKDPGTRERGWVYNVGWSPSRQRFVATEFDSARDFEPREVGPGTFSNPAVTDPAPDWRVFGEAAYAECSLVLDKPKTMIGGALMLTRLEREGITQRRLLTLPDDDWRFRQMVIGTVHPYGQLGPCVCGSGQPYMLCHLPSYNDEWPCPCTSGQPFRECHRIDPFSTDCMNHWVEHAEDFYRTREPLRATWRARFPDAPEPTPLAQVIRPQGQMPPPAAVLASRAERRRSARAAARRLPTIPSA